jgi:type II secretory pathway component PulF
MARGTIGNVTAREGSLLPVVLCAVLVAVVAVVAFAVVPEFLQLSGSINSHLKSG